MALVLGYLGYSLASWFLAWNPAGQLRRPVGRRTVGSAMGVTADRVSSGAAMQRSHPLPRLLTYEIGFLLVGLAIPTPPRSAVSNRSQLLADHPNPAER